MSGNLARAAASPRRAKALTADGERRTFPGTSWDLYLELRRLFDESGRSARLTYSKGLLEIMNPSYEHEDTKTTFGRLLEAWALARGVALTGLGQMTFRSKAKARGLEPDECYYVGAVTKDDTRRRAPDVALEVALTSGGIDKLPIYADLGFREVCIWDGKRVHVHVRRGAGYAVVPRSEALPALDLAELTRFLRLPQAEAVGAYFARLTAKAPRRARKTSREPAR